MGDLTARAPGPDRRGQLLLAGAFVLAAALVGLTLVFSATSYTATLADSDNAVASGSTALTVRDSVDADLGRYLQRVNRKYSSNSKREDEFEDLVSPYHDRIAEYYADNGQLLDVSLPPSGSRFVDGTRVSQTTDVDFDNPSDSTDENWAITPNVGHEGTFRNVTFIITKVDASSSDRFRFVLYESGGDEWELTIHENSDDWIIRSPTTGHECVYTDQANQGPVELDFADATVDGDYCRALEVSDSIDSPYGARIEEGKGVEGRYWMTLNPAGVDPSSYESSNKFSSSQENTVLYAARIDLAYQSATVSFDSRLRIAPEEIP